MKKLCLLIIIFFSASNGSYAWEFNHTWIDPNLLNFSSAACPGTPDPVKVTGTNDTTCCTEFTCDDSDKDADGNCVVNGVCADGKTVPTTITTHSESIFVPVVNETCFHPTCYLRAVASIEGSPMPVQPLTNKVQTIKDAINSINVGQKLNVNESYVAKLPDGINGPQDNAFGNYIGEATDWTSNYYSGSGTSSMQGLLWSWRMLSTKWQGYWSGTSNYEHGNEDSIAQRGQGGSGGVAIPSNDNAKNIIIISDGVDSDGPQSTIPTSSGTVNYTQGTGPNTYCTPGDGNCNSSNLSSSVDSMTPNQKASVGFHRADTSPHSDEFETCDAHAPIQSITYNDYVNVCNKLLAENIRVNVVFYGTPNDFIGSDGRLEKCASITHGVVVGSAVAPTSGDVQQALADLLAAIAVHNIHLLK